MGKPEGKIEDYLRKRCRENDILCYKFVSPGHNGVPDRILIRNGHTIYVELKSESGKLQDIQKYRIGEMQSHGADVRVVNSCNCVDNLIKEVKCYE